MDQSQVADVVQSTSMDWITGSVPDPKILASGLKQLSDQGWSICAVFPFVSSALAGAQPTIVIVGYRPHVEEAKQDTPSADSKPEITV